MSSKRHQRRKSCEGKIQYATLGEALQAKRRIARLFNDFMQAYKCEFGNHFHQGHAPHKLKMVARQRRDAEK